MIEHTGTGRSAASEKRCAQSARVVRCIRVCYQHVRVEMSLMGFPHSQPGQFLQVLCRAVDEPSDVSREWPADGFPSIADPAFSDRSAYLRRPFSIADQWIDEAGLTHLAVISRAVGTGTSWLDELQPGQDLDITGPLGHGFDLPAPDVPLLLVGGGAGIPPLLYACRRLHERGHRDVTLAFGSMTRDLLPLKLLDEPSRDGSPKLCVALPGGASYPAAIASNDGSIGVRGIVTETARLAHEKRGSAPPPLVLACGPRGMLGAIAQLTRRLGLDCQLCIERTMGCGIGACLSCVVRVRDDVQPEGWRWALACTDGPVFWRDELID